MYTEPIRERKTRSDKGITTTTERDVGVWMWVAEQYAIPFDQLQRLVGRTETEDGYEEYSLSIKTIEQIVKRWKKLGFVETQKFFHRQPRWLWLSHRGLTFLGRPFHYWEANVTTLAHIRAVNEARFYIEQKHGKNAVWRSERTILREEGRGEHLVDAEVLINGNVVGIEVELTPKESTRIKAILRRLAEKYPAVCYFTNKRTQHVVTKALTELAEAEDITHEHFQFYLLDEL
jgi:hypothetical protein